MKELKIAKEVAEKEFEEWCETNDIDADVSAMDEEDAKDFNTLKKRIVKAVCLGRATFDGKKIRYIISEHTQIPDEQRTVEIAQPNGYTYTAMDGFKKGQEIKRLYAALSQMTGLADGMFRKMSIIDINFFQSVFSLFFAE